jgi:hypothetical protein
MSMCTTPEAGRSFAVMGTPHTHAQVAAEKKKKKKQKRERRS